MPVWARRLAGLVVVGLIVLLALVASGSRSTGGQARFRLFQTAGLTTLVPVGWTGQQVAAPPGTSKAAFHDATQPDFQLAVTAVRPAVEPAQLRATKLRELAATRLGYVDHFFGRVLFPGGRPAWLLAFESDGFSHVIYVYTACKPSVAMTVEVSAPLISQLEGVGEPIAASTGPQCG
jgi:hypothetical protein